MTKKEAIDCMKEGKKVRHKLFTLDEFIYFDKSNNLVDENGMILNQYNFWKVRSGSLFDSDWNVVPDIKTIINIGTTKKNIIGVEFNKPFDQIKFNDISKVVEETFGQDALYNQKIQLIGWADVTNKINTKTETK